MTVRPEQRIQWLDDNDEPIEHDFVVGAIDGGVVVRDAAHWLAEQVDHAQTLSAAPGPRLGGSRSVARRRGAREEIMKPVHVDPRRARELLRSAALFETDCERLSVDHRSVAEDDGWLTWRAAVRTPWSLRRAVLRIGPTPSGNLTIIQLVPERTSRLGGNAFVRAGVPAIVELSTRIRTLVRHSRRSARSYST